MNKGSTVFLKAVLLLLATGVLAGLMWFPHTEGRATNLDLISIYTDPFIIYIYVASIPFFVGVYQAIKVLHYIDAHNAFSPCAVTALKTIKLASLSIIGFIALALLYIHFFVHGDDPAGPTMLGMGMAFACGVIATTAGVFQQLFQQAEYRSDEAS
jgi:hypothetical protein